jgi:hypothetical protein
MLRRAGLEAIGGFPVDSSIHHGECSALLMGKGYTIATLDEVLQFTCAKPTYQLHVKAMMKDGLGALRTASRLNFFIGGNKISQMSARARLSYLSSGLRPFLSIVLYALMLSYPYMFSYGGVSCSYPTTFSRTIKLKFAFVLFLLDYGSHSVVYRARIFSRAHSRYGSIGSDSRMDVCLVDFSTVSQTSIPILALRCSLPKSFPPFPNPTLVDGWISQG